MQILTKGLKHHVFVAIHVIPAEGLKVEDPAIDILLIIVKSYQYPISAIVSM